MARAMIPNVKISTDIIAGFCGETEEEHRDTVLLMEQVRYDQAFMFAYSLREKTHAARTMEDDVPEDVKLRRLQEIITTFRTNVVARNHEIESGALRLVLVEGLSSKATTENPTLTGRTDGNQRVVFDAASITGTDGIAHSFIDTFDCNSSEWDDVSLTREQVKDRLALIAANTDIGHNTTQSCLSDNDFKGQYVVVKVIEAKSTLLKGVAIGRSTILEFENRLATKGTNINASTSTGTSISTTQEQAPAVVWTELESAIGYSQ